jgi:hypothetical protein
MTCRLAAIGNMSLRCMQPNKMSSKGATTEALSRTFLFFTVFTCAFAGS